MKVKMKVLFIFFFLLSSGRSWMPDVYVTGEHLPVNSRGDIIRQLVCQMPSEESSTGTIINASNPIYRDCFSPKEAVWAAVNLNDFGENYERKNARLYVVFHKDEWPDKSLLKSVPGCEYKTIAVPTGCKNMIYVPVWKNPGTREEGYDVVVDFAPFGCYNKGRDILDGGTVTGFYVPEEWVCLEEIYFNFDDRRHCCDAMNIRKNREMDVHVPEWKRGEASYPAAFLKNRFITVKAVFSAAPCITKVHVYANTTHGDLGNIIQSTVEFGEDARPKVTFSVSGTTPNDIRMFYQQWQWYYRDVNLITTPEVQIGSSRNKIFIVLSHPQCPWTINGQTEPWTDVLDQVCRQADKETTTEGAAEKITYYLYRDVGGSYDDSAKKHHYTGSSTTGDFYLTDFLDNIPHVNLVNCHDMGKALVTFSNILGCNLSYRRSYPFGDILYCVKLIGKEWACNEYFDNHAFASIGDEISDASLCVDSSRRPGTSPHVETSIINILWDDYKDKVVKEGETGYPDGFSFGIGERPSETGIDDYLEKRLEWAKKKYDFPNWGTGTGKIIPGVDISKQTLPLLDKMKKMWKKDIFRMKRVKKSTYSIIRKWWKSSEGQFDAAMVVCPTSEAAKDYLILRYADTSGNLPDRKHRKDIGNMCLVIPEGNIKNGSFFHIDFIRYNVLIMMSAKGRIKKKLGPMAKKLDDLLLKKKPVQCYSQLKERPMITRFYCEKKRIKKGESVPLGLAVKNPGNRLLRCLWRMSGGGIEKDCIGNPVYYGGEEGIHTVTVTVMNESGLYDRKSLKIEVNSR